jgi:beta-aspartyl-dipeptidase (metallo-type)
MFKLLKNGHCLVPEDIGINDILIAWDKICGIKPNISPLNPWDTELIDCQGCFICPGIIDGHVHITGGGGEGGPESRIPELMLSEIFEAGVTTLVGVLGFDNITRNIAGLLAKARGLEAEGLTTFIYTGSYSSPTETLTGRVVSDLVMLDKVIGVGEVAISDYRSNHPSLQDLRTLAVETIAGGMLGAKAGILHLHVGDGQEGLSSLFRLIDESDFPISMFVPTHINRKPELFSQGMELLQKGGNVDLTAGERAGYSIAKSLSLLKENGIGLDRVTISSDGNGSSPDGEYVGAVIRGDRELNEVKLKNLLGCNELLIADENQVSQVLGVSVGSLGPVGAEFKVYADQEIELMDNFICGANEDGYHLMNVNLGRDFVPETIADLRNAIKGDPCPVCSAELDTTRGIEVGHIFKLGTKYSEAMKATFLDKNGQERPFIMGCYGIGISRTMAAAVEQNHDENGIIWPLPIAPYQLIIVPINTKKTEQMDLAWSIYEQLSGQGLEVIIDDRDERAGVKFKDADLTGIPLRITIGPKALQENKVEVKKRWENETVLIAVEDIVEEINSILSQY